MKVPTFRKFGLTKAQIARVESRDKKISDILTHHLTVSIGLVFGLILYIIYFNKVRPDTFLQIVFQVFLFGSIGIICVGVPAMLFKLAEMFYFKQVRAKTDEHKSITRYHEEREVHDFWQIRKDFSFWKMLDGLSFEKEVMNIYLHLGYEDLPELDDEKFEDERILKFDDKLIYFTFYTKITEFKDSDEIDKLLIRKDEKNCERLYLYSQSGFSRKLTEGFKDKPVNFFDINELIKVVRTVKDKTKPEKKEQQ